MPVISALVVMLALGTGIGLLLALSASSLRVPQGAQDERRKTLTQAMPGLNCGACGYPSCEGYAAALCKNKDEDPSLCTPGGNAVAAVLGRILGREAGPVKAEVAFVKCQGSPEYAKSKFEYQGLADCQAAAQLFRGSKSCQYGCIGLGSCVKQCPVDAIVIDKNSLAVVDAELCIGCRKCLPVCPTGVIQMMPKEAQYTVACNALDHGKATRSNCKVGCIGCRICELRYPNLHFTVQHNLASVDFAAAGGKTPDPKALAEVMRKCPANCIVPVPAVLLDSPVSDTPALLKHSKERMLK